MIKMNGKTLEFGTAQMETRHAKALCEAIYNHHPVKFEYAGTAVNFEPQHLILSTQGPRGQCQIHDQQLGEFLGELDHFIPLLHTTDQERLDAAVDVALHFGSIDGAHHKAWVIDQMLRHLLGPAYQETIRRRSDADYPWDEGIAP